MLQLRIVTPAKIVMDKPVSSITLPAQDGEITILPRHIRLFSLLKEGIIGYTSEGVKEFLAIGGGYVETDGKEITVLVSRAYGQSEIDIKQTEEAIESAKKILSETKDEEQRKEAIAVLRRSVIDMKLVRRRRTKV